MSIALLFTYATAAFAFWVHSLYRMLRAGDRRERWISGLDLAFLAAVGLLSSAAWPLLLPVYGAGWMMSAEGRGTLRRLGTSTLGWPAGEALPRLRLRGARHGA